MTTEALTAEVVVVADSGPLIALARIGRLDLLKKVHGQVLVPRAVWEEVAGAESEGRPGASDIRASSWVKMTDAEPLAADGYSLIVDRGEAEAIALARQLPAALLLIDDGRGRRLAQHIGVRIKGTLGVLVMAKRRGLLVSVGPEIEGLRQAGVHVARFLVEATLREVGEA